VSDLPLAVAEHGHALTGCRYDFEAYAGLRRALKDRESQLAREGAASRRAHAASSLERLKADGPKESAK